MSSTKSLPSNAIHNNSSTRELDIYAAEFAKLVNQYPPVQTNNPSDWLERLPNEAFLYYDRGIATFGGEAKSPIDRRGRLYLVHTALVFMWMSWGKSTARKRFQTDAHRGTCRAASLITLEHYRRGDVLSSYKACDWFFEPVKEWTLRLNSAAVNLNALPPESDLRSALHERDEIDATVNTLSLLRSTEAIPSRRALVLA